MKMLIGEAFMASKCPQNIKLVVFDFDGVFTDNYVYVDQEGREMVRCTRSDGIGLEMLRKRGIKMLVLSMETNPIVERRCAKLKLKCITGCDKKLDMLKKVITDYGLDKNDVCYMGNDLPDLECMQYVGFPVAVKDSHPEVLKVAKYVTKKDGGKGAVRELCEYIKNCR